MTSIDLSWMPARAPYMPIATVGILALLEESGQPATAIWDGDDDDPVLRIDASVDVNGLAQLLIEAEWPALDRIAWRDGKYSQGLKPTLAMADAPAEEFKRLVDSAPPLEAKFLRSILTDGVLDDGGIPARSRLLRGVKADLSSIANRPKRLSADALAAELRDGPSFPKGESGLGLGLVPEVQTFGGSTGPDASTVGAYSPLLYLLLWQGLMALPPIPVMRGHRRVVGGPLVTGPDSLSWPRWRMAVGLRGLRTLLSLAAVHADEPDRRELGGRGMDAIYRARAVPLSTMVAVFRWGVQVMR